MRVVASAIILSQQADVPLEIHWFRTPDLNVRFDGLFDPMPLPAVVREKVAWNKIARVGSRCAYEAMRLRGWRILNESDTTPDRFDPLVFVGEAKQRNVVIRTNSRLIRQANMFRWFDPIPDCKRLIAENRPLVADAIGVHIRRTDNRQATRWSPTEVFVELMNGEVRRDAAARFFLASDSPAVSDELRARFPGRIHEIKKTSLERDDPIAIREALVDLYCLANTKRLIGSYWSSFTDTAAEINGIECQVARVHG
jgi:hypothetical protein